MIIKKKRQIKQCANEAEPYLPGRYHPLAIFNTHTHTHTKNTKKKITKKKTVKLAYWSGCKCVEILMDKKQWGKQSWKDDECCLL